MKLLVVFALFAFVAVQLTSAAPQEQAKAEAPAPSAPQAESRNEAAVPSAPAAEQRAVEPSSTAAPAEGKAVKGEAESKAAPEALKHDEPAPTPAA